MSAPSAGLSIPGYQQNPPAQIEELLANPPRLHRARDFNPADDPAAEDNLLADWGIQKSFLRLMVGLLTPASHTLETGSGLSTICMAIAGCDHVCISPIQKEHNRIQRYCSEHGISTGRIRFIPMTSDAVLPSLDLRGRKLDFALIDGSHAFPDPFIDYYYVNRHLKVGGLLAVDDLNISSVGLLHSFLVTDSAYEIVKIDEFKTGLYRKVRETSYPRGWLDQKFNSKYPDFSFLDFGMRVRQRLQPLEWRVRNGLGKVPGLRHAYHWIKNSSKRRKRVSV